MKNIKEYISESLFDSEDDLLDKTPDQVIYDYLKSIVRYGQIKYVEENFYIKNGIVYYKGSQHFDFTLEDPMPSYMKFDKKTCSGHIIFSLIYDGISQKDLDRLPDVVWLIESNVLSIDKLLLLVSITYDITVIITLSAIIWSITSVLYIILRCFLNNGDIVSNTEDNTSLVISFWDESVI